MCVSFTLLSRDLKTTSGYIFTIGGGLQFHGGLVNTATTEVEWFKEFLMDLSMVIKTHMMLSYSGNTVYMIEDPVK
jgi:hypothetical protein